MKGLLLTGPTGVGKSTVQEALCRNHGFWVPQTLTTRDVEKNDAGLVHLSEADFLNNVRAGDIVLPANFGGNWYGWSIADLERLRDSPDRAVLNVRPYPALMLQALISGLVAVWLTIDDSELSRRRDSRRAFRDTESTLRNRREMQDKEDLVYRDCFSHVCLADEFLVSKLIEMVS